MLWRLVSANGQAAREDTPSYSEVMAHVDQGDAKEVTMYLSPNSYELQGEYVKPANKKFHTTILKEDAPNLSRVLREKQVLINVKEVRSGVLRVGPPGTGNTSLARTIGGEANVPFFSISGADFVERFVVVGASRVREWFEQCKEDARWIIFIDGIEAAGRHRRVGPGGGHG